MSDGLNLGADHEQSKRLVEHWYKMFFNSQERVKRLTEALKEIKEITYGGKEENPHQRIACKALESKE